MATAEEVKPTATATETLVTVDKKAELPAVLEKDASGEYKLPEGYEMVDLRPWESQSIQLGAELGSETVCYAGKVGIRLRRAASGTVFFSLLGFDLPKKIDPIVQGRDISLGNIGPDGIPMVEDKLEVGLRSSPSGDTVEGDGFGKTVVIWLPGGNNEFGFSLFGPNFEVVDGGVLIGNISAVNNINIAVPVAAVREGEAKLVMAIQLEAPRKLTMEDLARAEGTDWTQVGWGQAVTEAAPLPEPQTPEPIFPVESVPETAQQRFSRLVDEVKAQIQDQAAERAGIRDNLLEMFDLAAEITGTDPAGEQKLVKGLVTLLRVAKSREVVFSSQTLEISPEERRGQIGPLVEEMKTLIQSVDFSGERMAEVLRQLLDHTVALGNADTMGVSLARLLKIARTKQVKLGGE